MCVVFATLVMGFRLLTLQQREALNSLAAETAELQAGQLTVFHLLHYTALMPGGKLQRGRLTVWEFILWGILAFLIGLYSLVPIALRLILLNRWRRKGMR